MEVVADMGHRIGRRIGQRSVMVTVLPDADDGVWLARTEVGGKHYESRDVRPGVACQDLLRRLRRLL
jgi:hypothetical protein